MGIPCDQSLPQGTLIIYFQRLRLSLPRSPHTRTRKGSEEEIKKNSTIRDRQLSGYKTRIDKLILELSL